MLASRSLRASLILAAAAAASCGSHPGSTEEARSERTAARFDPIVGGVLDDDSSHDAIVMLYNAQVGAMCTGTVISQDGQRGVVLTARHCVSEVVNEYVTCGDDVDGDYPASDIYILRGKDPQNAADPVLGTGDKLFHVGGSSLCNADFAVVVMNETVSGLLPLRVRVNAEAYQEGELFTAIGYGLTNPNNDNSAGRRYLRENVELTNLGPKYGGLFAKEFQGTSSICSGDSGGPAVSANWAVMGITSRGSSCYGNDNIWTRVDSFKDVIDEAMAYANSSYVAEEGAPPWPGGTGGAGGTGGSGGTGGAAGAGGSGGNPETGGAAGGPAGSGGDGPQETGGAAGTGAHPPTPSCGDLGPCPAGDVCVEYQDGTSACAQLCNTSVPCPEGNSCDETNGVCLPMPQGAAAMNDDVSVTGGCAVASHSQPGRGAFALAALTGLALVFSRRRRPSRT